MVDKQKKVKIQYEFRTIKCPPVVLFIIELFTLFELNKLFYYKNICLEMDHSKLLRPRLNTSTFNVPAFEHHVKGNIIE